MNVACANDGMTFETGYVSDWTHGFYMSKETYYMSEKTARLLLRGAAPRPVLVAATVSGARLARRAATLQEGAP